MKTRINHTANACLGQLYSQVGIGTSSPDASWTLDIQYSEENKRLGVYYSDMIPVTTKAIQEQQELILKLEQRINSIENKK